MIRLAETPNLGRKRFSIAHELGHYVLHPRLVFDKEIKPEQFTVWNKASEEAEANYFAAELLMPEFLFKSRCKGTPSLQRVDELAEEFGTSFLATVFQYHAYTPEPVAVVLSTGWSMTSFRRFQNGFPRIRFGEIHEHSAAGERLEGIADDSKGMVSSPAYAWLEGFAYKPEKDIKEDSRYLEYYDTTVTLLWHDNDLS